MVSRRPLLVTPSPDQISVTSGTPCQTKILVFEAEALSPAMRGASHVKASAVGTWRTVEQEVKSDT